MEQSEVMTPREPVLSLFAEASFAHLRGAANAQVALALLEDVHHVLHKIRGGDTARDVKSGAEDQDRVPCLVIPIPEQLLGAARIRHTQRC